MGYRSEVAFAISAEGWKQLQEHYLNVLDEENQNYFRSFLTDIDSHSVTSDGDHGLYFSWIKMYATDCEVFRRALTHVDMNEWYWLAVGEDGAEESDGGFYDNPFNIHSTHSLGHDIDNDNVVIDFDSWGQSNKPVIPTPVQDNHTCACGNTKCSKTEVSCWRCGAPIV